MNLIYSYLVPAFVLNTLVLFVLWILNTEYTYLFEWHNFAKIFYGFVLAAINAGVAYLLYYFSFFEGLGFVLYLIVTTCVVIIKVMLDCDVIEQSNKNFTSFAMWIISNLLIFGTYLIQAAGIIWRTVR